jgi:hypothetical protein
MDEYIKSLESLVRGAMDQPIVHDVEEGKYCYFCGAYASQWRNKGIETIELDDIDGYHTADYWIVRALDVLNSKQQV